VSREERIWIAIGIVVSGFVAAVAFHYFMGHYRNLGYPYNTFLFMPSDAGMDYYNILDATRGMDPYGSRLAVYFPLTYIPFAILSVLPRVLGFAVFEVVFVLVTLWFVSRQLDFLQGVSRRAATLALTLPTYPFLFCLDRGNVEMLIFVFLCFFFVAFERERWLTAALFLAMATAMKLYPGVFAILFLRRRQYRAFAASIVLTIGTTIASVLLYDGGIPRALKGMAANLAYFRGTYILDWHGYRFNSSWFGAIRYSVESVSPELASHAAAFILPYTIVCLLLFAAISLLVLTREMPFWQQVLLLGYPMILFPEVSFDYKLIHCLFPFVFFLRERTTGEHDRLYAVLLSLLLVPMAYHVMNGDVNSGIYFHPAIMSILMLAVILESPQRRAKARSSEATNSRMAPVSPG
jgi:uncharacterized membrane protein SirB2